MERAGVPTARALICESLDDALAAVRSGALGWPVVVKADGLAGGKGVVIAPDAAAAEHAVRAAMVDAAFGAAGSRLVLEECLVGDELSYFVIADGERFVACGSAQDHKRLLDGDAGPNTGGMGAFAPSVLVTEALAAQIEREIVQPVLTAMTAAGTPFRGFLYCGLMLTADGPKVIEFNCRFGDPEAQVVLPLLDEPLSALLLAASTGQPLPARARFSTDVAAGVVLASAGYPGDFSRGHPIGGLERVAAECPGAACPVCRRRRPRRRPGHRRRPRAHRGRPGGDVSRGDRRGLRRRAAHHVRRPADAHRHRPTGAVGPALGAEHQD